MFTAWPEMESSSVCFLLHRQILGLPFSKQRLELSMPAQTGERRQPQELEEARTFARDFPLEGTRSPVDLAETGKCHLSPPWPRRAGPTQHQLAPCLPADALAWCPPRDPRLAPPCCLSLASARGEEAAQTAFPAAISCPIKRAIKNNRHTAVCPGPAYCSGER